MDKFIVSARKYRPSTFETLIGQDSIATTLKNSIKRGQLAHAYLFCGPRGVGKTTTARIFAKIINCMNPGENMEPCGECESCKSFDEGRSYCIHELDAASNNSVDDIRALTEKVMIPPQVGKYSVYIIDEVHMLSTSAFNAFLKTLEEPPAHAIFILATTEKQKIIPTILSRCQVYDFNRISVSDIVKNLKYIAQKENVNIEDNSLHVIAQKADGAMRDALTLFDQVVAFCGNDVKYEEVIKDLNVLDYDYYFSIVENSINGRFAENLVILDDVLSKGFNALYFVGGLSSHLRNLLICKETASAKLLECSEDLKVKYTSQSQRCALGFLFKSLAVCEKCEADYARSNNQRLLVEFMLVRLSQLQAPAAQKAATPAPQPAPEPKPVEPKPAPAPAPEPKAAEPEPKPEPKPQPAPTPEPKAAEPEPAPAPKPQPAAPKPIVVKGINSLLSQAEKAQQKAEEEQAGADALGFMGPSHSKQFTITELTAAWRNYADEFEKKQPKAGRFVSTLRQTEPLIAEDGTSIIFKVGNSKQKEWIEKYTAASMTAFLRKALSNNAIQLVVETKSPKEIQQNLYMPAEKDNYMTENNAEFKNLKEDLGAELIGG